MYHISISDMEIEEGIFDFRLQNDSSMIVVGASKCGKSSFVLKLIQLKDKIFQHPIRKIWWFYGVDTPFHDSLDEGVILKKGNLTREDFELIEPFDLVILDDLQMEVKGDQDITNLFLKGVHHKKFFAIQINQYIYGDKDQRMRNSNAHYMVFFKNPRNRQVAEFVTKMLPKGHTNTIHNILQEISHKYGYLFIDFTPESEDSFRMRTNVVDEDAMIVFKLHSNDRSVLKRMDYSRMIVLPEKKYLSLKTSNPEQIGAGKINPIVEHMRDEKRTDNQVKSMMNPQEAYVENLAKSIIQTRPTTDSINQYNLRLTAFDNIRRKFFQIPPQKVNIQTNTTPIQSRDMETNTSSKRRIRSRGNSPTTTPLRRSLDGPNPKAKRYDTRTTIRQSRLEGFKENKRPRYPEY